MQRDVSRLVQKGRLARGEQEMLLGMFKLEAAEEKEEDHCGQEEEGKREMLTGQFLTGERRERAGARSSFDQI